MSTDSPVWDARLEEVGRAQLPGAPEHATHHRSAQLHLAVWGPATGFGHDLWALVRTPAGTGGAWVRGSLAFALGMQLGGVAAAIGQDQVLLRRNGPRLRIADRIVRVTDERHPLVFRSRGPAGAVWRHERDGIVWQRVDDRATVAADAEPDHVAFVLLTLIAGVETGVSALSFLQGL